MRRINCGVSGVDVDDTSVTWDDIGLSEPWDQVIAVLAAGTAPRPVQVKSLREQKVLGSRRNVILSAPTNSGKSLVASLIMLEAVRRQRRALLIEPLRALAREKLHELEAVAEPLTQAISCPFSVQISTGDYRLEHESFADPPRQGEILIATPERLDAIIRNPDYDSWLQSLDVVCVDEAHLLRSRHRGPTLEFVLTSLRCMPAPPRLVLMSATLGDAERLAAWLSPCDVINVDARVPSLSKEVLALDSDDDANAVVISAALDVLRDPAASLLIFVYQTRSATRLATELSAAFTDAHIATTAYEYHSQISREQRALVRDRFHSREARCVVATTALSLGVNLPATHVIVRDSTFPGAGRLPIEDLLQMIGRAGRGNQPGNATIFVRPGDGWDADDLADALRSERLSTSVSAFDLAGDLRRRGGENDSLILASLIGRRLARVPDFGMTEKELREFFDNSLSAVSISSSVDSALEWLSHPERVLAYQDEHGRYRLTTLGLSAVRATLPLPSAAGIARLLRDLLSIDALDELLGQWTLLDHLIIAELTTDRPRQLRRFSEQLVEQVDGWMESHTNQVPMLYRRWIVGKSDSSRADEVLGSLGLSTCPGRRHRADQARQIAYLATFHAILLMERGRGHAAADIDRRWGIRNFEAVEEQWRDERLWILAGLGSILDLRCYYYHLMNDCGADIDRVRRVDQALKRMARQCLDLRDHMSLCSPLGPLIREMRRTGRASNAPSPGIGTIRRLESAGVRSLNDLSELDVDDLIQLGVRRDLAKQIRRHMNRRMV